jgi:hypothetical protein
MTPRVTAAALAVVAGIVASCSTGLGGPEEEAGRSAIVVDESVPRYGNVGFGSTTREVERLLGRGETAAGFAPAGRSPADIAVPLALPNPQGAGRARPALRRYEDSAFLFLRGRVYAILLTASNVETARGVGIGDAIETVRRSYEDAECREVAGGESLSGDVDTYPSCRVRVAPMRFVFFGGNPIRSIAFYSAAPVD